MASNVTDDTFEAEVLKSDIPVLVDFWAEWCGPCKMLTPIIEELAKEFNNEVKVVKVNIDENPSTPSTLGIRSIPTMVLYQNGKVVDTKVGVLPKNSIAEWINSSIK
jgi:thioredoxin 1